MPPHIPTHRHRHLLRDIPLKGNRISITYSYRYRRGLRIYISISTGGGRHLDGHPDGGKTCNRDKEKTFSEIICPCRLAPLSFPLRARPTDCLHASGPKQTTLASRNGLHVLVKIPLEMTTTTLFVYLPSYPTDLPTVRCHRVLMLFKYPGIGPWKMLLCVGISKPR